MERALVGRSHEMAVLARRLGAARSGDGGVAALTGEAGIGKSRLALEAAREAARSGFSVVWGRCAEAGGAPSYWPWAQVLRALRRSLARKNDGRAAKAATLLAQLRGEVTATSIDPSQARFALFESVADFLFDLATADAPLALVFEDVHVADASSLALLRFFAGELVGAPVFVVVTYRDAEVAGETADALRAIGHGAVRLSLMRLGLEDVRTLVAQYGAPPELAERIHRTTEGHPLFVEELARVAAQSEELATQAESEALPLPAGVRDAIARRLALLDASVRALLAAASVGGREIDVAMLARVIDQSSAEIADALARAPVVERTGEATFTFEHVLVKDVLYRELPPARRSELHARFAEHVASAAAAAEHLLAALETVGSERAFRGALEAARRARRALAFEDAASIAERALEAVPRSEVPDALRAEALVLLGETRIRSGSAAAGKRACVEAAVIARALGDTILLAHAALACGAEITVARTDRVLLDLCDEALGRLPAQETALRARVMARLAGAEQPATDPMGPVRRAREAIALARASGDGDALRAALEFGGSALVDYAEPDERLVVDREMRDLAATAQDLPGLFRAHTRIFFDECERGDRAGALASAEELERIAAETGWPRWLWTSTMVRSCVAAKRGAFHEAHALRADAARHAYRSDETYDVNACALALLEDDTAALVATASRLVASENANPSIRRIMELIRGAAAARAGDVEGARALLVRVPRDAPFYAAEPLAPLLAADIAETLEDQAWARTLAAYVAAAPPRVLSWGPFGMAVMYPSSAVEGRLAAIEGRLDDAAAHFTDAERRAREAETVPGLCWILYWHARVRARANDPLRAHALFDEALALARTSGLPRLAARIDAERGTSPPPQAPKRQREGRLTMVPDGDGWMLRSEKVQTRLRDSRGLRMLARLLAEPHREFHVLLLSGEGNDPGELGSAGDHLDAAAVGAYRARVEDLRDRIAEAEGFADHARAGALREELDFLVRELAAGVGLGGRHRKAAAMAERARVNVQRRIKDAIRRVGEVEPGLGEVLAWTVRTGTFCVYRPPKSDVI